MSVNDIKNALEGVTPDLLRYEADAMFAAIQGEQHGDTFHVYNWADKPHRVLYDAIDLMRKSASTLESLQRENEEKSELARAFEAEANQLREVSVANRRRAEAAEAEVKRYRSALIAKEPSDRMLLAGSLVDWKKYSDKKEAARDVWNVMHRNAGGPALASTGGEHHAE
ncbi:hypothetical protein FHW77_001558 [Agrobacterium sp. RC10-4-1]|uniref:hypothetical protein n=1 Tax=Agrobacterium sp. RC10-4-1 TaxID=2587039 RepID=UPI0015FB3864|nr:hypothetical protein [Agrobacterium sp. RC10-4-1]MBA8797876.1 hypothetical protein [Agrobacterium sp. RC10-4-1]